MLSVTINGRQTDVPAGRTVLEAAADLGITIPTLCYHKDLSVDGSCRLCMVEVDASGTSSQAAACTQPVADSLVVRTETPAIVESRQLVLRMLLENYSADPADTAAEGNELVRWARHYDVAVPKNAQPESRYPIDSDPNPFIRVDLNQCILCTRCVRACAEVQGRFVWGVAERGHATKIVAGLDTTMLDARCESCGACAAYCPTGALTDRMTRGSGEADRRVTTICGYCGVGCQFDLNVKDNRIIGVTSRPDAPVNGMSLCVKGRYGYDFVHHPDRLTRPRVRKYLLDGSSPADGRGKSDPWVDVDWDTALDLAAQKLAAIRRESGPDAVGVLSSAKCTNEENYLMQKFARQVIGTHNVDHCARLCHSSSVAALVMCYGSGAMSNSMDDIAEHAASIFVIGANPTEQHPVFGTMIRQAVLRRGMKLVVADPRRIDITEFATLHLRHNPGSDAALLSGLMHIILKNGWHDRDFIDQRCEGFDEFAANVEKYPPEIVEQLTGVPVAQLRQAAEIMTRHRPMSVIWGMGISQHTCGVMNVLGIGNLQMLLGNVGVPGGGVNPLRGQNNVQGACDMGALVNVLPGYQSVTNEPSLAKFDTAWALDPHVAGQAGTPALGLRDAPGLTVTEMVGAAGNGSVRGLYILGEDPAMTEPDLNHALQCLRSSEFVVLQEIFPTETAQLADILLPGITFAEKSGTFTNTERQIQLVRKAVEPPGEARPDWQITSDLAKRILAIQGRRGAGPHSGWEYESPTQIMDEIAALTPSYAGISYARLERGVAASVARYRLAALRHTDSSRRPFYPRKGPLPRHRPSVGKGASRRAIPHDLDDGPRPLSLAWW